MRWRLLLLSLAAGSSGELSTCPTVPFVAAATSSDERVRALAVAKEMFLRFKVETAVCEDRLERDNLIACVEAGFGAFEPFNRVVRRIFTERIDERVTADLTHPARRKSGGLVGAAPKISPHATIRAMAVDLRRSSTRRIRGVLGSSTPANSDPGRSRQASPEDAMCSA